MSQLGDGERYVLDTCVIIDFCGRSDSLSHLMEYVGDAGVITSSVHDELKYNRKKRYSRLAGFLELVDTGVIAVIDPDLMDDVAARIVARWSRSFGAGEVSCAALAASRDWVFVSQDLEPMRQLRLSEHIFLETTDDVLKTLVRYRRLSDSRARDIKTEILRASRRRRR